MLLGSGLLPHLGIAGGGGLTGATWAIDGSGRAYNTPTGTELLTNGGMEGTYTAGVAPGWTILGTVTPTESADAHTGSKAQAYTNTNSTLHAISQSVTWVLGRWYFLDIWSKKTSGGGGPARINPVSSGEFAYDIASTGAYTRTLKSFRLTSGGGSGSFRVYAGDTSGAFVFDDASCYEYTTSTLHASVLGASNALIASARINALASGTQAGTFALADDPTNPQNGIYAYHDGTGVTLDKLVAGTWSNVNARVTVAFSADADLEIRPLGSNQFDVYYGGVKRGSTATISDASIVDNLYYGLFSTYSGNTFTQFTLGGNVVPFGF